MKTQIEKEKDNLLRLEFKTSKALSKIKKSRKQSPIDRQRSLRFFRTYGITLEDYNELFCSQNGCCAICNKHQSELNRALAIDHCHKSGEIRGLLCNNCNRALGLFKDDMNLTKKATEYLLKNVKIEES